MERSILPFWIRESGKSNSDTRCFGCLSFLFFYWRQLCFGICRGYEVYQTHIREYKKGSYTIIDLYALENFERKEIWHGWDLAKSEDSKKYFKKHGEYYSNTIDRQLYSYRVFISEIVDVRKRERIEAALMLNAYQSYERWADLVPRGMSLKGRFNCEIPIIIKNKCHTNIIGIPDKIEI